MIRDNDFALRTTEDLDKLDALDLQSFLMEILGIFKLTEKLLLIKIFKPNCEESKLDRQELRTIREYEQEFKNENGESLLAIIPREYRTPNIVNKLRCYLERGTSVSWRDCIKEWEDDGQKSCS